MVRSISKLVLVLLALMSPLATGCSGGPQQEEASTGTLSAALVTQGSDGATYQFPTGTFIDLRLQGATFFSDFFSLDAPNETLVSRRIPAGSYVAALDPERREALRRACLARLGEGPFVIPARAWAVRGIPSAP